jgi:hypothetical protein
MRPREIALERRRLDRTDRDGREHERRAAIRIAIRGERRALQLADRRDDVGDGRVIKAKRALGRLGPARLGRPALLAGRRLLRAGLLRSDLLRGHRKSL